MRQFDMPARPTCWGKRIQLWSVYKRPHQSVGHAGILKQRMRSGFPSPPPPFSRGEIQQVSGSCSGSALPWRAAVDRVSKTDKHSLEPRLMMVLIFLRDDNIYIYIYIYYR